MDCGYGYGQDNTTNYGYGMATSNSWEMPNSGTNANPSAMGSASADSFCPRINPALRYGTAFGDRHDTEEGVRLRWRKVVERSLGRRLCRVTPAPGSLLLDFCYICLLSFFAILLGLPRDCVRSVSHSVSWLVSVFPSILCLVVSLFSSLQRAEQAHSWLVFTVTSVALLRVIVE